MASKTNQIARYRVIDECLNNRYHLPSTSNNPADRGIWPIRDLQEAIEERTGLLVSGRTVQEDINRMRYDMDLAYYAPIQNKKGIGYFYEKPFTLTETRLGPSEIRALKETIMLLKQFKGFKYFEEVEGLIYNINTNINKPEFFDIQFDTLPDYRGLDFIQPLEKAITEKSVLKMVYKPFDDDAEIRGFIHPYLLKEYNNRWFVYAFTEEFEGEGVYGLERIIDLEPTEKKFRNPNKTKIRHYFKDIIGVTNYKDKKTEEIILRMTRSRAHYLRTKPVHKSQTIIKETENHVWFRFLLKPNQELTAFILNFGSDVMIEKPDSLRKELQKILSEALSNYEKI